jgi:hypothetical protein
MKCWHCKAQNARHSSSCWACGIQLSRSNPLPKGLTFRPEAMRHYNTATVAMHSHRAWLDGLVLLSTVLFGLLLGHFVADVLPTGAGTGNIGERFRSTVAGTPLGIIFPAARALPLRPVGEAQLVNGVVAQIADIHETKNEAGREAPAGSKFLTATVVVDNQGAKPVAYNLSDWKVRDSRGRANSAQTVATPGWISSGRIASGQKVQGMVTFLVPETEAAAQVTFSPAALGAQLRWDASQR